MKIDLWQHSSEECTLFSEFQSGHAVRHQEGLSGVGIDLENLEMEFCQRLRVLKGGGRERKGRF